MSIPRRKSCKVERRDAETGALLGEGRAPHPATTPPRSEQDPTAWWDALQVAASAAGARDVDAVSVAGQQHGMVVLDDAGAVVRPAKLWNDTESAHRCRVVGEAARRSGSVGRRVWLGAARRVHDREAVVVAPVRARRVGATRARLPAARLVDASALGRVRHRSRRRVGHRLLQRRGRAVPPGSPRRRRRRTRLGEPAAPVLGPGARAGVTTAFGREAIVAAGTGDNMAAALGVGLGAGRRRRVDRDVGHGLRGERRADRRRNRRGRGASRTRPAASFRWCAR